MTCLLTVKQDWEKTRIISFKSLENFVLGKKSQDASQDIYIKKKETRGKDALASPSFEKILKNCLESFWCWWKKETMQIRLRLTQMFPLFLSLPSPLIPLYVYLPSFSCRLLLIINWDSTRPNLAYHLKILGLLPHQLYGKGKSDTINTGIIKTFENIKRVALWLAQTSSFFISINYLFLENLYHLSWFVGFVIG